MPEYYWDEDKDNLLKQTRNISFEDVVSAIKNKNVLADIAHSNQEHYYKQRILVIKINGYVYAAPYVPNKDNWFLKTIYPNRKYNKKYLIKEQI